MKKILISIGIVLVAAAAIYYMMASRKFELLNARYVQIEPGMEDLIVLVNVGNGDRKYISEKINEVFECKPRLLAVDLFFKDYSQDEEMDTLLLASFRNSKPILATRHDGSQIKGVNDKFLEVALDYGYAELSSVDGYVANFDLFRKNSGQIDYHFAYSVAKQIDSTAASLFAERSSGNLSDVVISKLTSQFKIFDFNEKINCESITNKVVLFGYLGPTDEDKLYTYARYHDQSDDEGPDMYGPVVVANQILMILKQD